MTHEEFREYWVPAAIEVLGPTYRMTSELDKLLGTDEYKKYISSYETTGYSSYVPMSEDLKNLLRQLAGPHGKTILKVYRIRRGLE